MSENMAPPPTTAVSNPPVEALAPNLGDGDIVLASATPNLPPPTRQLEQLAKLIDVIRASGKQLAVSEKSEWFGTTITLTSPSGAVVAELDRPWINIWSDTWNVYIKKPGVVDNGILVMIAAFKTASDRDHEGDSSSDKTPKKK